MCREKKVKDYTSRGKDGLFKDEQDTLLYLPFDIWLGDGHAGCRSIRFISTSLISRVSLDHDDDVMFLTAQALIRTASSRGGWESEW